MLLIYLDARLLINNDSLNDNINDILNSRNILAVCFANQYASNPHPTATTSMIHLTPLTGTRDGLKLVEPA